MVPTRRAVLHAGIGASTGVSPFLPVEVAAAQNFRAVAFDAFAIFDPNSIDRRAEQLYPGFGIRLMGLWRTRQFEYTWLRTIIGRYSDFADVTADALAFATSALGLTLTDRARADLLQAHGNLTSWPDARPTLNRLKKAGVRLALLSNFTTPMLLGAISASGLDGVFEHVLSTDAGKTYKPDPGAYQLGVDAIGLPRDRILFVAFAGWDAAGAKTFGYPTYWVNRLGMPLEQLGSAPDGTGADLVDLVRFVGV